MSKRILAIITALITMLAATSIGPTVPTSSAQNQPQGSCQTFKETGKTVCGTFLAYWKAHGDVTQQGLPISGEFKEVSETDGKAYTVQYFERAVFESHPENKAPYNVLLSLLGRMVYAQKYPNGAQELPPDMRPEAGMTFPETGKSIRGLFLEYWKSHGGLAQQGFPITNLVSEKSDIDGKIYTVQYFERAVFEMHPENKAPFDVLLSQLGTYQYNRRYTKTTPPQSGTASVQAGQWGGNDVSLKIDGQSISLEFNCAHGTINGTTIPMDAAGNFSVQGTYTVEHGGPISTDQADSPHPAAYTGTVKGNTLTLTIKVSNSSPTNPSVTGDQIIGPFTLTLNAQPNIHKCV